MLKRLLVCFVFLLTVLAYASSNRLFVFEKANVVYNGKSSGQIVCERVLPFKQYDGVFKSFDDEKDYENLIKKYNAKLVLIEETEGVVSEYYYSYSLPYKEVVKGKKVNLHVAKSLNKIVVGSPIIYGSY